MTAVNASSASLLVVAAKGQTDELTRLLERGEAMEATDSNGNTPLMVAANNGHAEAVGVLLKQGANPNMRNYRGETALMLAAGAGQVAVVPNLIKAGADVQLKNWWGETTEAVARKNDRQELADLLHEEGSKITHGAPSRVGEMLVEEANHLVPDDGTRCWFCERAPFEREASPPVTLFASMAGHGGTQGEWSKLTVVVPMCQKCKKFKAWLSSEGFQICCGVIGLVIGIVGACVFIHYLDEPKDNAPFVAFIAYLVITALRLGWGGLMGGGGGLLIGWAIQAYARWRSDVRADSELAKYPLIEALVRNGWSVGDKPPEIAGPRPTDNTASVALSVPDDSSSHAEPFDIPTNQVSFLELLCSNALDSDQKNYLGRIGADMLQGAWPAVFDKLGNCRCAVSFSDEVAAVAVSRARDQRMNLVLQPKKLTIRMPTGEASTLDVTLAVYLNAEHATGPFKPNVLLIDSNPLVPR